MASQEHYSLRWNNHQNHILRAFDTLLQTKTLVDVTLVCAETSIRAHKVVLSACSPFFQRVFSETPCKHPVIVLKDFRGWVVQAIVDFMYRGEISVPQERLQTLIQAGESLQVRGLVDHPVAGNTPTPAASPDEFGLMDTSVVSPASPPTSPTPDYHNDSNLLGSNKLLLPSHMFVDNSGNIPNPDNCTSPMPRRKQARPRRRSGECAPQDLSKPSTPIPQSLNSSNSSSQINTSGRSNSVQRTPEKQEPDDDDDERPSSSLRNDEISQNSTEGPENLCTKNSTHSNNNNNENINNNNQRIVLSLKDIRQLNRPTSLNRPSHHMLPGLPLSPPPSHPLNLNSHSSSHSHSVSNMKMELDDGRDSPQFMEQMDLSLAQHHHNLMQNASQNNMEHGNLNNNKDFTPTSPISLPPHFNHPDGHHPQSPLSFPHMSVSSLTLTPPHSK